MFNKQRVKVFTLREMVGLILILTFFCFGFVKGAKFILSWRETGSEILALAGGLFAGCLAIAVLVFSCMGIGSFLEKRKKKVKTKKHEK